MSETWMSPGELADLLGVSKWWVQTQVTAKAIPHHRVGRLTKFSPADVRAIEQRTAVPPVTHHLRNTG